MKKSITLGTIFVFLTIFFTLSFKSADNEKKDYVTIYCNSLKEDISLSFSNGTYKKVEYLKTQGIGDQTQILKLINEQEGLGYKLITYNWEPYGGNSTYYITTALLSK